MSRPDEIDVSTLQRVADMTALYRMYDATGRLLYVGQTGNIMRRLSDHEQKRWFAMVAEIRLTWFPTEADALVAERRAIQSELPRVNKMHNRPAREPKQQPKLASVSSGSAVTLAEAAALGITNATLSALKMARFRDPDFPESAGLRGTAKEYDPAALAAWDQARRS